MSDEHNQHHDEHAPSPEEQQTHHDQQPPEHAAEKQPNESRPAAPHEEQVQPRRRLGRGLNALLGSRDEPAPAAGAESAERLESVPVGDIDPNPFQPRKSFEEESLAELAESIRQHGLLQPVLVRRHGGRFQLIAGERRLLAARKAGFEAVPCRVVERDDRAITEAALEENLKRRDLNPLEKAQAFQDYRSRFGCSIEDLAQKLSMNRSTVSNFLRLLELPEPVKKWLSADKLSGGHARALLALDSPEQQVHLAKRIVKESLSVRATEAEVKRLAQPAEEVPDTIPMNQGEKPSVPQPSPHVKSLEEKLRQHLGLKVDIKLTGKAQGKLVIHFNSNEDFEKVFRQLRRAA